MIDSRFVFTTYRRQIKRFTRGREPLYCLALHPYRQRQIGQWDCDVPANCGKVRIPHEFYNKALRFFLKNASFEPKYYDHQE